MPDHPITTLVSIIVIAIVAMACGTEVYIKRQAYHMEPSVKALQDAYVASVCRITGLAGFAFLVLNRLTVQVVPPVGIGIIGTASILILAIPALSFVFRYVRRDYQQ